MKHVKFLVVLLLCIVLGCNTEEPVQSEQQVSSEIPSGGGGGSSSTSSLTIIQSPTLALATNTLLASIRNSPSSFLFYENGVPYADLKNVALSQATNYARNIRVLAPSIVQQISASDARAQIVSNLTNYENGTSFKANILSTFDYITTIHTQTFAQFETYFENKLNAISNPPFGISKLSEAEKFALTQVYYSILNQIRWVYQNPPNSSGSGCSLTQEEWKNIAIAATGAALMGGTALIYKGAVAGAMMTGNPAGAVIGGILGFVTGAITSAAATVATGYIATCLVNMFVPIKAFSCNGKIYYARTVSPPIGCSPSGLSWNSGNILQGLEIVSLNDILSIGIVPNKGRTAVAPSVIADISAVLGI